MNTLQKSLIQIVERAIDDIQEVAVYNGNSILTATEIELRNILVRLQSLKELTGEEV